jgi:hypothetical protein
MQGKRLRPEDLDEVRKAVEQGGPGVEVLRVMLGHIAALEAEFASLKPSGQVAEDVATVRRGLARIGTEEVGLYDGALHRLAVKAHGYDAAVVDRDKAWSERATAIAEKHSAVADNAALVDLFGEVANAPRLRSDPTCAWCGTRDHHPICPVGRALATLHPGAALLETHRKEVAQAREQVLRNADVIAHEATCPRRLRQDPGVECHLACPVRNLYEGFSETMPWTEPIERPAADGEAPEVTRYTAQARIAVGLDGKVRVRPVNLRPVDITDLLSRMDMFGHSSTCPRQHGSERERGAHCSPACPVRDVFTDYGQAMPWETTERTNPLADWLMRVRPYGAGRVMETATCLPHVFNPAHGDGACQAWVQRKGPETGEAPYVPCGQYLDQHFAPTGRSYSSG